MLGLCCCMGFSLVTGSRGYSSLHCSSFLLQCLLLLQSTGSRALTFSSCSVCACVLSYFCCVWLFEPPWTVDHQAPLSMEFSRQEYWSRLPFPSPGDFPNPGTEPRCPRLTLPGNPRVVVAQGLNSCGSPAPEHRLSSYSQCAELLRGMWDLPGSGIELESSVLVGGFLTTEPPGKPAKWYLCKKVCVVSLVWSYLGGPLDSHVWHLSREIQIGRSWNSWGSLLSPSNSV